jgi:competence ComEA-like helix-hairpin-helix protein
MGFAGRGSDAAAIHQPVIFLSSVDRRHSSTNVLINDKSMIRRHTDNQEKDFRLPVLILIGVIIFAAGRYTPEPDLRVSAYYLSSSTEKIGSGSEVIRVDQSVIRAGAGEGGRPDVHLTLITPDLSCAETPPELALFFNLALPVNQADHHSLTMLSGIGPKLAEKIISFREERGDITGPEDFIRIKGIGPKMTERLTPLLCFSGADTEKEF